MARTALAAQKATHTGTTVTYAAANALGHSFFPEVGRAVHVKNGSGGSITVTIPTPLVVDGDLAVGDRTVTVAAAAEVVFGIGPSDTAYRQPDGSVWVDFSAVTSVTVALIDGVNV